MAERQPIPGEAFLVNLARGRKRINVENLRACTPKPSDGGTGIGEVRLSAEEHLFEVEMRRARQLGRRGHGP